MNLNAHKFGLAAAISSILWCSVVAFFVTYYPQETLREIASFLNFAKLASLKKYFYLTPYGFAVFLAQISLFSYVVAGVFAFIYNLLNRNA